MAHLRKFYAEVSGRVAETSSCRSQMRRWLLTEDHLLVYDQYLGTGLCNDWPMTSTSTRNSGGPKRRPLQRLVRRLLNGWEMTRRRERALMFNASPTAHRK